MKFASVSLLFFAAAFCDARSIVRRAGSDDITAFLQKQVPFSVSRMSAHINAEGAVVAGAAAPVATANDPYQYFWVRDGGLTMAALADQYASTKDASIPPKFDAFFAWTQKTQKNAAASSPGWFTEKQAWTKYSIGGASDGMPYQQWMSPQYDGPALRASAFMKYAAATGNAATYYNANDATSVIKCDLDAIVRSVSSNDGYEPWEEVVGNHFFDHIAQYRALTDGAAFVAALGDSAGSSAYSAAAQTVKGELDAFWNANLGLIQASLNAHNGGQNQGAGAKCTAGVFIDVSTILGIIHGSDDTVFPATDPRVQATFYALITAFADGAYKPPTVLSNWALNTKDTTFNGLPMNPAVGRYPEDIYDGTNYQYSNSKGAGFWFLATNAMAETLYKAVAQYDRAGSIVINSINAPFWTFIGLTNPTAQTITKGSQQFDQAQALLLDNADRFLRRTSKYVDPQGYMSEQFNGDTGAQMSTQDLAWSYASVVSANLA
ncbi:glycoside hydrolase 15 protein, partial [Thoreauomyces humboldtii]